MLISFEIVRKDGKPVSDFMEKLPEGLHILAGAPKVGKSWLALWLCLCVAKGESVWDFAVTKELFIAAFEDNKRVLVTF